MSRLRQYLFVFGNPSFVLACSVTLTFAAANLTLRASSKARRAALWQPKIGNRRGRGRGCLQYPLARESPLSVLYSYYYLSIYLSTMKIIQTVQTSIIIKMQRKSKAN
jgi:hypothetical protein